MKVQAVVGLGFGDEGKGLMTDYLCSLSENPLVIRYSGGQQAGHTVVLNGVKHVFSNFGSGTLRGVPTYWSEYCTMNPINLYNEFLVLKEKGVNPLLYMNVNCPVTTPYDVYFNQQHEVKKNHGSCGAGINATITREEQNYHLVAGDLFYPSVLKLKLGAIRKFYNFDKELNLDDFFSSVKEILTIIIPASTIPMGFDTIIFEGSQGLLLDPTIGFFPNVTRTNTGSTNILKMGFTPEWFLVTRAYQTRHGNGPMTNLDLKHNILVNPNETNQTNKFQGKFKRSVLDLDLLSYAICKDKEIRYSISKNLTITCIDHIKDSYQYTYRGNLITCSDEVYFTNTICNILRIENLYISKSEQSNNIIKVKKI